jgi:hypothetical protein
MPNITNVSYEFIKNHPLFDKEAERVYKMYPHLNDDEFVKANLDKWLK